MWEKEIWIAKRKSAEINEYGVEIETFEKPIKYAMNYQPVSGYTDYAVYGDKMRDTYRAFVNRLAYQNIINVGDRVYLSDGQLAESELEKIAMSDNEYCEKANYSVYVVLPQNYKTQIDFMKR